MDNKESNEKNTEVNKGVEYILSMSNLLTRIGDHLVLVEEVINDYDDGDITLEVLKLYIGDFIMIFSESYYPEFLNLETTIVYYDYHKYLGRAIKHIGKSIEYFQSFIDLEDENEILDNLNKALLEIGKGC